MHQTILVSVSHSNVHNIACIYTIIQMWQSYLNVVYERDSSHIYRSSDFLNDLFTMKVLLSALTRYMGFFSTCQLLVSLKLEKYYIENTTALQTL